MKKFLSFIFWIAVIAGLCILCFYHRSFIRIQANKVMGMYYVHKGDQAYKNFKMNKAIGLYNQALRLYPGHYGAWYNLGNIYVAYEDYYSALDAYSQAFKYNPNMMIARMNYGIVSTEKLGNFDAALDQYDKIIATDRKLLSIPYIYDNRKSTKDNKAIAYYNKGVTYRMKSVYSNKGWESQRAYLSQAITSYKNSLEIDSKRYDTWYNLAVAYHLAGDYTNAGKCYCKAINLSPLSYESHYNLAVLLRKMKRYDEAYDEIEKASTLISALDKNPALQEYASVIMTDIMKHVNNSNDYTSTLTKAMEEEKSKNKKHLSNNNKKSVNSGVVLVNGKVSTSDEADKSIISKFGKCPYISLFKDIDD